MSKKQSTSKSPLIENKPPPPPPPPPRIIKEDFDWVYWLKDKFSKVNSCDISIDELFKLYIEEIPI